MEEGKERKLKRKTKTHREKPHSGNKRETDEREELRRTKEEESEEKLKKKLKSEKNHEKEKSTKRKHKIAQKQDLSESFQKKHKLKTMISDENGKTGEGDEDEGSAENLPTVSIAVAGSIIDNAQSPELATRLAGQIARAATIFRIDEVIVFDDKVKPDTEAASIWDMKSESGALFLARILSYLEIPQYLRRALVPKHSDLRNAGLLPPLDAPHHARKHEWVSYREGVTLDTKSVEEGTFVDVGLHKPVRVMQSYSPGLRVTVSMGSDRRLEDGVMRHAVDHTEPKKKGFYWGYSVRYASNFSAVLKESPYKNGYDYSIGTSEHGDLLNASEYIMPEFRHLLIAFGGLGGLEEHIEEDEELKGKNVRQLFNSYLNVCPNQGSRTIRTEEAILISLQYFSDPIRRATCNRTRR